jgi:hypothetical protein
MENFEFFWIYLIRQFLVIWRSIEVVYFVDYEFFGST